MLTTKITYSGSILKIITYELNIVKLSDAAFLGSNGAIPGRLWHLGLLLSWSGVLALLDFGLQLLLRGILLIDLAKGNIKIFLLLLQE
jgi:hypothetical protein